MKKIANVLWFIPFSLPCFGYCLGLSRLELYPLLGLAFLLFLGFQFSYVVCWGLSNSSSVSRILGTSGKVSFRCPLFSLKYFFQEKGMLGVIKFLMIILSEYLLLVLQFDLSKCSCVGFFEFSDSI